MEAMMGDYRHLYTDENGNLEPWAKIAEDALGVDADDVESQARDVARHAASELHFYSDEVRRLLAGLKRIQNEWPEVDTGDGPTPSTDGEVVQHQHSQIVAGILAGDDYRNT